MTLEGTWDLVIATPIGRSRPVIDLRYDSQRLAGIAYGAGEQVPLRDIVVDGNQVSWAQSVTKPLRLNLTFTVTIDGDELSGTSKAGRLPSSKVTGQRRPVTTHGASDPAE
jgi:hypothetical protein